MRRNVALWGTLHALAYLAGAVAFGVFVAPCTAGCLAITEMAKEPGATNPAVVAFFATITIVGFANGAMSAKRRNRVDGFRE